MALFEEKKIPKFYLNCSCRAWNKANNNGLPDLVITNSSYYVPHTEWRKLLSVVLIHYAIKSKQQKISNKRLKIEILWGISDCLLFNVYTNYKRIENVLRISPSTLIIGPICARFACSGDSTKLLFKQNNCELRELFFFQNPKSEVPKSMVHHSSEFEDRIKNPKPK